MSPHFEIPSDAVADFSRRRWIRRLALLPKNSVSEETRRGHPEIPWNDIIGLRHRLVHVFEAVDLSMVRQMIVDDLPSLIERLRVIVGEGIADFAFPRTGS